jgi:hypothetical protein
MMEALLGVAAALAALALLARAIQTRRARRDAPGGSVKTAVRIAHFDEIDATVADNRCDCGGRFTLRGEGPVAGTESIRRARIECRDCGAERELYFDMAGLRHPLSNG